MKWAKGWDTQISGRRGMQAAEPGGKNTTWLGGTGSTNASGMWYQSMRSEGEESGRCLAMQG